MEKYWPQGFVSQPTSYSFPHSSGVRGSKEYKEREKKGCVFNAYLQYKVPHAGTLHVGVGRNSGFDKQM